MELQTINQNLAVPAREDIVTINPNRLYSANGLTNQAREILNTELTPNPPSAGLARISETPKNITPFITANSEDVSLSYLKEKCVIPVFTKDNEITISHTDFIETAFKAIHKMFPNETFDEPEIRVSHQIKGRVPEAIHKNVNDLQDHEKTQYYERMGFVIRIPSITENINGHKLALTIGGVRSYNLENLYNKKTYEKFKFFIGFQNMVCCNLCISTDGFQSEMRVMSYLDLEEKMMQIIQSYNANQHLNELKNLLDYTLTERDFAQIIGKGRLYNYLPKKEKSFLPELLLNDGHLSTVAKDYYQDESFCRNSDGDISMWEFYNLLTGSNKASYLDTFLDRGVNAFQFSEGISKAINGDDSYRWFLS
ncbi:DUF3871 family protein [Flavobacterium piscis]|uniref:DUF3871 family protein n=1 Tax=Flavobacterium piscis TaxID=1114874 RepID=A0ABU1Y4E8_9FLAO|nr:DUF3871 family protein [Flavobacterium piscis]MDR7208411.1 hypothetical protein [Flavobacterium piscis]